MSLQETFQEKLSNLNSADSQWGIWVNPDNIDDYRVGQFCFENGGLLDNKICIGSLDKLSFGFQSQHDAIAHYLKENHLLAYKGRKVKVNKEKILQAWSDGYLDEDFSEFLEDEAKSIMEIWAKCASEEFVINQIPQIIEQALKDVEEESSYAYQWEE